MFQQNGDAMLELVLFVAAMSFAMLAAYILGHYRHDLAAARQRIVNRSRIVNTTLGPIEYAEAGEGTPVLVVHGAGGGFDQGMLLGEELVSQGMRVIAPSRFGYLRTPLPVDASAEKQADAHASLLDALHIDSAVVIAHSAGAPSAAQLAIRHPERVTALVLTVPAMYLPRLTKPVSAPGFSAGVAACMKSNFLFWVAQHVARRALIRTILGTPTEDLDSVSETERANVNRLLDSIQPISERIRGLMNEGVVVPSLPRYDLESITAPTLCISAADCGYGTFAPARYTAEHIPNARFIGYARGGHVLAGHTGDWLREVTAFIAAVGKQPEIVPRPELAAALT
jgi:pimeloyl-ACP methyl ester carboxylesterase